MSIDTANGERTGLEGKTLAKLAILTIALPALPGCQSLTGSPQLSQLRIVDASPDSGAVDVYLGGAALAYNIGTGYTSTYVPISPGTYAVGVDTATTKQQLISASGTFLANAQYTVLVENFAANLQELVLKDQSQPAPANNISVRFIDASYKAGALDLYMIASGATLAMAKVLATDLTAGTNSGYLNIPAGTYTLVAVPTGTVPATGTATLYTGTATGYGSGVARTIVLSDATATTVPGVTAAILKDYDTPEGS
jgi:hypothetical protein